MSAEDIARYIQNVHLPRLDAHRARRILAASEAAGVVAHRAHSKAHKAAILGQIEKQAVTVSEKLRGSAWTHVWDSTQGQALAVSWVLARLGMGIATADLVGTGEYGIEDDVALVKPWAVGFPEFPLPVKE